MASSDKTQEPVEVKPFETEGDGVVADIDLARDVSVDGVDLPDDVGVHAEIADIPVTTEVIHSDDEKDSNVEEVVTISSEAPVTPLSAVVDLIYWRDVKKTAGVFSFILLILVSLICYSVLTVLAYAALAILVVTVGFRLYRLVLQTLNGTQQPHPFQEYMDIDLSLSPENAQKYATVISTNVNCIVSHARDLLLVKSTLSSLKFGVFLWLLTYVGACFNGLTILIIDVILIFTAPPIYEKYQAQIDGYYGLVKDKVNVVVAGIKDKLPGKKEKTQ